MKTLHSDEAAWTGGLSIFLAGPTPRWKVVESKPRLVGKSWRPQALQLLEQMGFRGTVLIPERRDWSAEFDYIGQVEWEKAGLSKSTINVFWVPRRLDDMRGLDTNVEFGYWMSRKASKVVYGRPDDADRHRYLDWMYKDLTGRTPINSLEETLRVAIASCKTKRVQ